MNCVIEDGYNTLYLSTLLVSLFHSPSVIDRCLLLENNSQKLSGILLQKIIERNFVNMFRCGISITSKLLNQIRICAYASGWKNSKNIDDLLKEDDPILFLIFIMQTIEYCPLEITNYNHENYLISKHDYVIEKKYCIQLTNIKSSVQESYNDWINNNNIINIPQIVIFQINNLTSQLNINKKIWMFPKEHEYHMIRWHFYSIICYNGETYQTIINKNDEPYMFYQNSLPCIKKVDDIQKNKYEKIYIIYTKEPIV